MSKTKFTQGPWEIHEDGLDPVTAAQFYRLRELLARINGDED